MSTPSWGQEPDQNDARDDGSAPTPRTGPPAAPGDEVLSSWASSASNRPADPYGAPQSPYGAPAGRTAADPGAGPSYPGAPYGSTPGPGAQYPGTPYPATPYPGGPTGGWTPAPATDPLAIASLVTSIASVLTCGLTGPVGLGLGIAAVSRTRRNGTQGRGLAVAGIVIGAVFTALLVLWLILALAGGILGAERGWNASSSSGSGTGTTSMNGTAGTSGTGGTAADQTTLPAYTLSIQLTVGDCLAEQPAEYDMSDAVLVDCASTHDTEVLGVIPLSAPVTEDLLAYDPAYSEAVRTCTDLATNTLTAVGPLDSLGYVDFYYPHPAQWDAGGRSGYCVLVTDDLVSGSAVAGTLSDGPSTDI